MSRTIIGTTKPYKNIGRVNKSKKTDKFIAFQLATSNGFIECASFDKDIIDYIEDDKWVEIVDWYPRQSKMEKDGKFIYKQQMIINALVPTIAAEVIKTLKECGYSDKDIDLVMDKINNEDDVEEQIGKAIRTISQTKSLEPKD